MILRHIPYVQTYSHHMQLAHLIQILLKEPADVWRVRLVSVSDPLADLVARVRLNGHLGPVGDVGPGGGWNGQLVRSLFYSVIVRSISGLRMLFLKWNNVSFICDRIYFLRN